VSESSLELLEADEHADVPRAQTQKIRHETFPKSCQTTLLVHFNGAVTESGVGSFSRVHVSRFDDVYWGSDAGGDEAGDKCRHGVARKVVRHQSAIQDEALGVVVRDQLAGIHYAITGNVRNRSFPETSYAFLAGDGAISDV